MQQVDLHVVYFLVPLFVCFGILTVIGPYLVPLIAFPSSSSGRSR